MASEGRACRLPLTDVQRDWIVTRMAEIVKVVTRVEREQPGVECQMCGRAWVPKDMKKLPKRCRYADCRSMRWDATKYPNAGPPQPPRPPQGTPDDGANVVNGQRTCYQTPAVEAARKPATRENVRSLAHAA